MDGVCKSCRHSEFFHSRGSSGNTAEKEEEVDDYLSMSLESFEAVDKQREKELEAVRGRKRKVPDASSSSSSSTMSVEEKVSPPAFQICNASFRVHARADVCVYFLDIARQSCHFGNWFVGGYSMQMRIQREKGLQTSISENNVGHKLLAKMGFKEGMALGRKSYDPPSTSSSSSAPPSENASSGSSASSSSISSSTTSSMQQPAATATLTKDTRLTQPIALTVRNSRAGIGEEARREQEARGRLDQAKRQSDNLQVKFPEREKKGRNSSTFS